VQPLTDNNINATYQHVNVIAPACELLVAGVNHAFSAGMDFVEGLLAITAVHPMDKEALRMMLESAGESWSVIDELLATQQL